MSGVNVMANKKATFAVLTIIVVTLGLFISKFFSMKRSNIPTMPIFVPISRAYLRK